MNKILDVRLFKQNPKLAYCTVNSMRTLCEYYMETPLSRIKIKKDLATGIRSGTSDSKIDDFMRSYFRYLKYETLSEKRLLRSIKTQNPILISYKCGIKESHSSIICGFKKERGVLYVTLCDSWLGFYDIPFNILQYLIKQDSGNIYHLLGV